MVSFLGIDPGASGGLALIDDASHGWPARAYKMPETPSDLRDLFLDLADLADLAVIEKVGPSRGQRGDNRTQGVSSAFKFGLSVGMLRMACIALVIPLDDVSPSVWQREFGLVFPGSAKLSQTEKKNRNKAKAQELFPTIRVTHATADALLIAEWARRRETKGDRQ